MVAEKAAGYFTGSPRYNCAQSVLKAFQEVCHVSEEQVADFRRMGGGRAEGGLCGALYAARALCSEPEALAELETRFEREAGSIRCREIRKLNRLKCEDCVRLAAAALNELKTAG